MRAKRAKRKLARANAKRAAELVKKTIKSIEHHEELLVEAKKRGEGKRNRRPASKKNRAIKKGQRARPSPEKWPQRQVFVMSNSPSETRSGKHATLYRMVMEKHICPWGLKSKDLGAGEHSPGRSIV